MFYANMYNIDCPKAEYVPTVLQYRIHVQYFHRKHKHTLLVDTRKCLDEFGDENSSATHDLENEVTNCC